MSKKNSNDGFSFIFVAGVLLGFFAGCGAAILTYEEGYIARIVAKGLVALALLACAACTVSLVFRSESKDGKGGAR
jgi:hypothetical protein